MGSLGTIADELEIRCDLAHSPTCYLTLRLGVDTWHDPCATNRVIYS
jgi:hypothetical protein